MPLRSLPTILCSKRISTFDEASRDCRGSDPSGCVADPLVALVGVSGSGSGGGIVRSARSGADWTQRGDLGARWRRLYRGRMAVCLQLARGESALAAVRVSAVLGRRYGGVLYR